MQMPRDHRRTKDTSAPGLGMSSHREVLTIGTASIIGSRPDAKLGNVLTDC